VVSNNESSQGVVGGICPMGGNENIDEKMKGSHPLPLSTTETL